MDPHLDDAREADQPGQTSSHDEPAIAGPLYERTREQLLGQQETPLATYRVQLHREFDFARASAIVPYLARLGVSHLYPSPILRATPGSNHGYDVVDHTEVNPELGGDEGFAALCRRARAATGSSWSSTSCPTTWAIAAGNALVEDVLENGPARGPRALLRHRLDAGQGGAARTRSCCRSWATSTASCWSAASCSSCTRAAAFGLRYFDHRFPLAPRAYHGRARPPAASSCGASSASPTPTSWSCRASSPRCGTCRHAARPRRRRSLERSREKEVLKRRLRGAGQQLAGGRGAPRRTNARAAQRPARATRAASTARPPPRRTGRTGWRYWRVAGEEINYRRFFDVNELAAIRDRGPASVRRGRTGSCFQLARARARCTACASTTPTACSIRAPTSAGCRNGTSSTRRGSALGDSGGRRELAGGERRAAPALAAGGRRPTRTSPLRRAALRGGGEDPRRPASACRTSGRSTAPPATSSPTSASGAVRRRRTRAASSPRSTSASSAHPVSFEAMLATRRRS